MDIEALKCFLAVAETGSFSAAAQRIYLTQPAVSKRIAALERELDRRLFDRLGRTVDLTEAGRALLPRAQAVLAELDDARRALNNLSGRITGPLRLATSHHIGLHRLPPALRRFHRRFPEVALDLAFMDSEMACQAVARGRIEFAIATLPEDTAPPLVTELIWEDPLEIVVGRDHPLAALKRPGREALLEYPALLPGPGTVTRGLILAAFGPAREHIQPGMTTNYLEVLKMLAATGLGWSALPHTMIDATLKVIHIDDMNIKRRLGLVRHAGRTLSNAAIAMIDIIRADP